VGAPLVKLPSSVFPVVRQVAEILGPFGVFRLVAPRPGMPPPGINAEAWATIMTLRQQRKSVLVQEGSAASHFELVRGAGSLGDLPLTILAAGKPPRAADPTAAMTFQRAWINLLGELAKTSTRGRHIVVPESGHMIPYDAPEAIIDATIEIIDEVRRHSVPTGHARETRVFQQR
jgi:hypothetical protein